MQTTQTFLDGRVVLRCGDCLEVLATMPENSVDSVVCDPPYLLEFMNRKWDSAERPVIDPDFANWLAGFVDGEGCFSVHKKQVNGCETYDCQFSMTLRADDKPILVEIKRQLGGIGSLADRQAPKKDGVGGAKPQARYCISSQADCLKLREVFLTFPLRAKKARDFEIWCQALDAWLAHEPGTSWEDVAYFRNALMAVRKYGAHHHPQQLFHYRWAYEVLRVLKPGGHLVAFSGTRTYHRMVVAIEDAGFEVRDMLCWHYGSGFPKSHNVSKGIDKASGAERTVVGYDVDKAERFRKGLAGQNGGWDRPWMHVDGAVEKRGQVTAPSTDAAKQWDGWGSALKPATEPIVLARKPLIGTIVENVLAHGTGALNIDGTRIEGEESTIRNSYAGTNGDGWGLGRSDHVTGSSLGRWPANLLHDGSPEVMALFPDVDRSSEPGIEFGDTPARSWKNSSTAGINRIEHGDTGSAARFFYTSKAGADDRLGSKHPTVKPIDLMQWLVRLVTPKRVLFCRKCDTIRNGKNSSETACPDTPVRVVPFGFQAEGQPAHGEILQQAVCGGWEGSAAETMRMVRKDISAQEGRGSPLLQPDLLSEMDRQQETRIHHQHVWVQDAVDAGPSTVPRTEGLHIRASLDSGAEDRQTARKARGRASQKWDQGGQPAGEFGTHAEAGPRQAEPAEAEHAVLPPLSGQNRHKQTCKNCGHELEEGPGICLDPFAGTGTTGEAAWREGFNAILIERELEYQADIARRMELAEMPTKRSAVAATKNKLDDPMDLPLFRFTEEPSDAA